MVENPIERVRLHEKKLSIVLDKLVECSEDINYFTQKLVYRICDNYNIKHCKVHIDGGKAYLFTHPEWDACYLDDTIYLRYDRIKLLTILHEVYHHLTHTSKVQYNKLLEEPQADSFADKESQHWLKDFYVIEELVTKHEKLAVSYSVIINKKK